MTKIETAQASQAMIAWFKSQGIRPHEAAGIMVYTLSGMLQASVEGEGLKLGEIEEIRILMEAERKPKKN